MNQISFEHIRGLIDGHGTFTFSLRKSDDKKIPAFILTMHVRDKELIEGVRDRLRLRNRVYVYDYPGKDGSNRGAKAILIVREIGSLKNIIVPLFYKRLVGNKKMLFENWIEKIGNDPSVPESYKLIYRLVRSGFYDDPTRFNFNDVWR